MAELKRRQFLKTSAWAGASLVGTSHRWANANDRIRVALIGAGGRGGGLIRDAHDVEGVEIVTAARGLGSRRTCGASWTILLWMP